MKRLLAITTILSALISNACSSPCEYGPTRHVKARVSVKQVPQSKAACNNDPVEIRIDWDTGSDWIRTTDDRDMPRACAATLGLVDGAELEILVSDYVSGGSSFPISPCERSHYSIPNFFWDACDAACNETSTVCPTEPPFVNDPCAGSLSCHYGDPVVCPPAPGWTGFYECVGGIWTYVNKDNCTLCAESCAPTCVTCADATLDVPVPPDQITFCSDTSAMLYDALWTCTCVPGNPCESICNTPPDSALCTGGTVSMACSTCVMVEAGPNGCADMLNACSADF